MTARAFEETPIEEGQASADMRESQRVTETPEDIVIDAARCGILLLVKLIDETKEGKKLTCTLQEIGQAIVGVPAPPPNWFEKVIKCDYQDKLLRNASRSLWCAINTLDNDMYATRVKACRSILEDAYEELKEDYGFEGDES
jgi:hypothetical protein